MTKRKEKETGMNKATQTGPKLLWEPTIPLRRGTSAPALWPGCHRLRVPSGLPL